MDITFSFGGLGDSHSMPESVALPLISELGAKAACVQGLDTAAALRRGVLVVGPKGSGKTAGLQAAVASFQQLEAEKFRREANHKRRQVLLLDPIRNTSYRGTAVLVAKALNTAYSDRYRGGKKDVNTIRQDVLASLTTTHHAVVVLDEAECATDETLQFLRDLMADAETRDPNRFTEDGTRTRASGVGILLVGDETVKQRLGSTAEASERWVSVVPVDMLFPEQSASVYRTWFPAFESYVESIGELGWHNYVASTVCRGGPVSFRFLDNHARAYVLYMARAGQGNDIAEIPFQKQIFENTLGSVRWGKNGSTGDSDGGKG